MTEVLDPQLAAFWASDPSLLTAPAPATETEARHDHLGRELAAAVLVAFALTRIHLNRRHDPDHRGVADQAWQQAMPTWMRVAAPLARQGLEMAGVRELSAAEVTRIATAYAESLGHYLSDSSGKALESGMAQQLAAGTDPDTAWKRAVAGYGLDLRQMRAYLDGLLLGAKAGRAEVVPPAAQARIDQQLLARADRIGQNEARNATATGQALAWAWLEKVGKLPTGTEKEWDTHPSERGACPVCAPLDRQRAPVGGYFTTADGMRLFSPLAHPGCRCGLRLIKPVIAKAGFDPHEPRDRGGRWSRGGGKPFAEPDAVAEGLWERRDTAPVQTPDRFAADRFAADRFAADRFAASRFATDSRFGTDSRFATGDRFAAPDDGTRFGVADSRFAARPRIRRRVVVIVSPPKWNEHVPEDTHYLPFADLAERYGWKDGDILLDGQPIDFDDANTRSTEPDLTAERAMGPWSALARIPSVVYGWEEEQRDQQRRDAWTKVLAAARVARHSALRNADTLVPHLDPEALAQIATLAGYDPNDPKLRGRIMAEARDDDHPDSSLADAYADYMVCVLPSRLGGAGDAVSEAAEEGPSFDLAAICLQPQQVFALATRRGDPDEITPEGEWHIHGLYYHSAIADDPHGIGPDVIGMQEVVLKREPDDL